MISVEDFASYVQERRPRMLRAARLITGSWTEGEDLLQEALLRTWKRLPELGSDAVRDAYLVKTMTRLHVRRSRRFWNREVPTDLLGTSEQALPDETLDTRGALLRLSAGQRLVLVHRFYLDMSLSDTAAAMSCSVGTVKSQTAKALARLRQILSESDSKENVHAQPL